MSYVFSSYTEVYPLSHADVLRILYLIFLYLTDDNALFGHVDSLRILFQFWKATYESFIVLILLGWED